MTCDVVLLPNIKCECVDLRMFEGVAVCCCQAELEALNSAADSINKLENELQVCTC